MKDLADTTSFLAIRLGAIGDVLRTIPAVTRIRKERPGAVIGWVVEDWVAPVLQDNPAIDRIHVVDRRKLAGGPASLAGELRRISRELRECRYDVALDFHARFKSGIISRMSGAPRRVGFTAACSTEMNHLFNNVKVALEDPLENRVLRFLHMLEPLGMDSAFIPGEAGIHVAEGTRREAEAWHHGCGAPEVMAYPGCSVKRAYSRWPDQKWIDLLKKLGENNISSVVFWGPAEKELAESIAAGAGPSCKLAPRTSLPLMMAMTSCFKIYVGGNTAAAHMAWLQQIPCAIFSGPVEPRTDSPLPPLPFTLLRADEYYDPRRNKKSQSAVTAEVPVDHAFKAVLELLEANQ